MSNETNPNATDESSERLTDVEATTSPSTAGYKTKGEIDDPDGVGVLGRNTASSGMPIGVEGVASNGFAEVTVGVRGSTNVEKGIGVIGRRFLNESNLPAVGSGEGEISEVGVLGLTDSGVAVAGRTANGDAVRGESESTGSGIVGVSNASSFAAGAFSNDQDGKVLSLTGSYIEFNDVTITEPSESVRGFAVDTGDTGTGHGGQVELGHKRNDTKLSLGATISGGGFDDGTTDETHTVTGDYGTISGGKANVAGTNATVGGGTGNSAFGDDSAIGGGRNNRTGKSGASTGQYATVPGGDDNAAEGEYSFAAGRKAKATNDGTFVWGDGTSSQVSSTSGNQFVVQAENGVGLGTTEPVSQLHVKDSVAEMGSDNLGRHVLAVENTESGTGTGADAVGIKLSNVTDPDNFNNYISFLDADDGTIGAIQGDSANGTVKFTGTTADFAEHFPKADPAAEFGNGEVVGLRDGEVVPASADVDTALVVSTAPIVTGNRPVDGDRGAFVTLSLVGQVPVQVRGAVESGDVLVASPDGDGTAVAHRACDRDRPVIGIALDGRDGDAGDADADAGEGETGEVLALVGGPGLDAHASEATPDGSDDSAGVEAVRAKLAARDERIDRQADRIDALEAENESMRAELERKDDRIETLGAENDSLRQRLAAVEDHLGIDGDGGASATADD